MALCRCVAVSQILLRVKIRGQQEGSCGCARTAWNAGRATAEAVPSSTNCVVPCPVQCLPQNHSSPAPAHMVNLVGARCEVVLSSIGAAMPSTVTVSLSGTGGLHKHPPSPPPPLHPHARAGEGAACERMRLDSFAEGADGWQR